MENALSPINTDGDRTLPQSVETFQLHQGSYRLRVQREGCHDLLYPIHIDRGRHWCVSDATGHRFPLRMMSHKAFGENDCFVHPGWFWSGGDPYSPMSLKRRRVWMPGYVIQRFPITNQQYLHFLNDLVETGREELALQSVPREIAGKKVDVVR